MRTKIRDVFDDIVETPLALYLFAVLMASLALRLPRGTTEAFVESSLPAMASVAFSLFGFVVTAVSILTSLKATPFFDVLQRQSMGGKSKRNMWSDLVGAFLHLAGVFAVLGTFSISTTKERIAKLSAEDYVWVVFPYLTLVFLAVAATVVGIYLLRLVANVPPPPKEKTVDQVDGSFLRNGRSNQDSVDLSSGATPDA